VHLVDASEASGRPDPVHDFNVIMDELRSFGAELDRKPMMVVASKLDAANPERLKKLKAHARRRKLPFFAISAVTGEGIDQLKYALAGEVRALRHKQKSEDETAERELLQWDQLGPAAVAESPKPASRAARRPKRSAASKKATAKAATKRSPSSKAIRKR